VENPAATSSTRLGRRLSGSGGDRARGGGQELAAGKFGIHDVGCFPVSRARRQSHF